MPSRNSTFVKFHFLKMNDKSRRMSLFEEKKVVVTASPLMRKALRFIQMMPKVGQKNTIGHKAKVIFLTILITGPFIVGLAGYVCDGLLEGLRIELMEGIYFSFSWFIITLILLLWLSRADEICDFLVANDTFTFGIPRSVITKKWLIRSWNYFAIFAMNFVHLGRVIFIKTHCLDKEACEFGLPMRFPMTIDNVFVKTYIYFSVIITTLYYSIVGSSYLIVAETVLRIASRIRHLEFLLGCIKFGENVDMDMKKLRFCIRYNTEILGLVHTLNRTLGLLLFPEYTIMIVMLSLLEYDIIFRHVYSRIFPFIEWFYGPVAFCECGNLMNEEYGKLRWAVYSMNWYEMRPEIRKTYLLLLGSVQKPVNFKAQPITALNRECLLQIVKGSYSVLMFLGRSTDRN